MATKTFKIALLALFLLHALSVKSEAAVTCTQVAGCLMPCLGYLRAGGTVPQPCCNGIRSLNSAAQTTPDRRTACQCLKSAAGAIPGINLDLAAGLPKQCGVNIPYAISLSTDCNRVK